MLIYSLKNSPDFFSAGARRGSALQPDVGGVVLLRGSNHRRWRKGAFSHVWPVVRLEVESRLSRVPIRRATSKVGFESFSGFGLRASGFGFRWSKPNIDVGFGFRVSLVSGFGFRRSKPTL